MALTTVRAKLDGHWITLAYNEATGRYEGNWVLTDLGIGTSIHQPGGYYSVEVEAANQNGETASISGEQLPALRLVVQETTAPVLTLASPQPGYLTTAAPVFLFDSMDEAGGSGVDPDSFTVSQPGTVTHEAVSGGYRFTWTPAAPWVDGSHTVTASVRDHDGNEASVSGSYTVDTVPPVMAVKAPYLRHIVDEESVEITVEASDAGTGVASVVAGGVTLTPTGNIYTGAVPLAIGENTIQVAAADRAGNRTAAELYMIRLVTDRTAADAERVLELCRRGYDSWTAEERAWWASTLCLRGSYDDRDLNRVGTAVDWLAGELRRRGYIADISPKTDWTKADAPVQSQMAEYLADVERVRVAQGLYLAEIPGTMDNLTVDGANAIERVLVEVDAVFPHYTAWTAGETTCGGI